MKKGNGVDISMPTAKSEYQDIINLAYAKFPDKEDRLAKVFRETTLNNYGARNMIEQMDLDLKKFKKDRDKYEYVDYFTDFLQHCYSQFAKKGLIDVSTNNQELHIILSGYFKNKFHQPFFITMDHFEFAFES